MTQFEKSKEEVVVIGKNGTRTIFPDLSYAKMRSQGLWKGFVDRIEVTTTYKVTEEDE